MLKTTIEKLPSGSYRISQTSNGQRVRVTVPYKPTEKEAVLLIAEKLKNVPAKGNGRQKFIDCALEYIEDRKNVNSPGTAKGYLTITRSMSEKFKDIYINDMTAADVQREVNRYALNHSAKSVKNFNGFITAVLRVYRDGLILHTSLPQRSEIHRVRASEGDVKRILEDSIGTKYHIPFQLGVLGLRRGEICALTLEDINGNMLTVNKDLIEDETFHWVIKPMAKTSKSNRTIPIPEKLANEIRENGIIFDNTPPMLVTTLHKYQKKLGIEEFRFHDLRSYCASYLHFLGYADKYIQDYCGWSSSYTMNRIYKEALRDKEIPLQEEMANKLI